MPVSRYINFILFCSVLSGNSFCLCSWFGQQADCVQESTHNAVQEICTFRGKSPIEKLRNAAIITFVSGGTAYLGYKGALYLYNRFTARLQNHADVLQQVPPVVTTIPENISYAEFQQIPDVSKFRKI